MMLHEDNYHSREANLLYMSVSQYKGFLQCESQQLAKLNGWDEGEEKTCFVIGSYVHAAFESDKAFSKFREDHPEIIASRGATKGELKAEFKLADVMIQTLKDDPLCMQMLEGDKEKIIVQELFGVMWKCKVDITSSEEGRLSDLKTVKSIVESFWLESEQRRVSFIEKYDYITQMAVYIELDKLYYNRDEYLEPFIVAVSKETYPDKSIICFDEESLNEKLRLVEENLPRIIAVKEGIEEPKRCEKCKYCRQTRKTEIKHYQNLLEV